MTKIRSLFLVVLFSLSAEAQQVALTFDDAPRRDEAIFSGSERTRILIEKLAKAKVQAAFFCVPRNLTPEKQKRLEAYASAGHILGNHSFSHPRIEDTPPKQYIADIKKAHRILAPIKGFQPLFRYPYLHEGHTRHVRDAVRKALKEIGYQNAYVTIDTYEWYINSLLEKAVKASKKINFPKLKHLYIQHIFASAEYYDNMAQIVLGRSPCHVLLLHENDLAALFIDDLIDFFRANGWEIISPAKAYNDPIAQNVPDVLYNQQGRIAAIANAKGTSPKVLKPKRENTEFLDALFAEQEVFEE